MPALVNLDGRLVPPAEATVSVFDRGLLAGDLVYEVLRTYGLCPFELAEHLARLRRSAERIDLALPWDTARIARELERTLQAVSRAVSEAAPEPEDQAAAPWNRGQYSARVVITRGAGPAASTLGIAAGPRAIIAVQPLVGPPGSAYRDGVMCLLVNARAPRFDPAAKTGRHLAEAVAAREAQEAGAHEALLLDERGLVTEGSSSNLFIVKEGRLATPPAAAGILPGITRALVLRLARRAGVPVEERPLAPGDLAGADEVFITSTTREVLPVSRIGAAAVGAGRPGPLTARIHQLYRDHASSAGAPPRPAEGEERS